MEREDYDSANVIRDEIKRIVSGGGGQSHLYEKQQPKQQQQYYPESRGMT